MTQDTRQKKCQFISNVNSLLQEFPAASPFVLMELINVYFTSFYGSPVWNLFSKESERIYTAWNVCVRKVFRINNTTHRYLIEDISSCTHVKILLLSRLVSFCQSLLNSRNLTLRFMALANMKDHRTIFGQNLSKISSLCNQQLESIDNQSVRRNIRYAVTDDNQWQIGLAQELILQREEVLDIPGFNHFEIDAFINYACTS